ncbi:MAG: pyridoxamine 5'-phosphate oxidase family protein [Planctomycetota bacterium]
MEDRPIWHTEFTQALTAEGTAPYLCVLATVDGRMNPTARYMYCREVTEDVQLVFISDRRTRKDDHVRERPQAEVVFWLESSRTQFRLRGHTVVVDAEMDEHMRQTWWARISDESRAINVGAGNGWTLSPDASAKVSAETPMPSTFEILVLNPEEVELLAVKSQPHTKRVWNKAGAQWTTV